MRLVKFFMAGFCLLLLILNGLVWKTHQTQGGNYWLITADPSESPQIPPHTIRYSNGQTFADLPVRGNFLGWTADGNWLFMQTQQALYLVDVHGKGKHKLFNIKSSNIFINPTQIYLAPNTKFYLARTPISKTHSALYLIRGGQATEITPAGGFVIDQLYWNENATVALMVGEGQTYEIELTAPYAIHPTTQTPDPNQYAVSLMSYAPHRIPYDDERFILEFANGDYLRYEWADGGVIYELPFRANRGLVRLSPDRQYLWLGYWNLEATSTRREIVRIRLSDSHVEQVGNSSIELKGVSPAVKEPLYHSNLLFILGLIGLVLALLWRKS